MQEPNLDVMINLRIDLSNVEQFVADSEIEKNKIKIQDLLKQLKTKTGKGNDFLRWLDLPDHTEESLINSINADAKKIRTQSEVVVVIGIGGSYLGARAIIEALNHHFASLLPKTVNPALIYAGQNMSEDYTVDLLEVLDHKEYSLVVISKSGTTTEPAIAFRLLKQHLENKYGKENSKDRIIAITDQERGALKELADQEGYQTYVVPDDVGGRYSVLTPVGLLPIAIAGFNIQEFLNGALAMKQHIFDGEYDFENNPAAIYAAYRNALYEKGHTTEIMVNYEPKLYYLSEWWKQLYGESEGKERKGIFPAAVSNTCDLHSMGQYIQDGLRNIFETVISVEESDHRQEIPFDEGNLDKLNYIAGKRISEINHKAELGTTLAHVDGGVPNIRIEVPIINEYQLGEIIFFFETACAISGYLLDVNPFDQPGVEAYKKNMFALLGKSGYENETKEILNRITK